MTDDIPDTCARCGHGVDADPIYWDPRADWREYLEEERDLGWYPTAPVFITCDRCEHELDTLRKDVNTHRTIGSDAVEEVENRFRRELDNLALDCVVDIDHFL